jgi:phosphomannomutase
VGVALFLSHLATWQGGGKKISELRCSYPDYQMSKNKIQLRAGMDVQAVIDQMEEKYKGEDHSTLDGLKIDFADEWVHLRKSNTEPIIRVYTESKSKQAADELAQRIVQEINNFIQRR